MLFHNNVGQAKLPASSRVGQTEGGLGMSKTSGLLIWFIVESKTLLGFLVWASFKVIAENKQRKLFFGPDLLSCFTILENANDR